jgi:hypothetical protein
MGGISEAAVRIPSDSMINITGFMMIYSDIQIILRLLPQKFETL